MSGTRSPSLTEPRTDRGGRWRSWRLGLALWPFATSAVAINLFLLGLIGESVGLGSLSPVQSLWLSLPLGLPATWAAARWVRGLIAQADRDDLQL